MPVYTPLLAHTPKALVSDCFENTASAYRKCINETEQKPTPVLLQSDSVDSDGRDDISGICDLSEAIRRASRENREDRLLCFENRTEGLQIHSVATCQYRRAGRCLGL